MTGKQKSRAVHAPNLGLYLGVPPLHVPPRGLLDCLNVRINNGAIDKGSLGWGAFPAEGAGINLDNKPVLLIELFTPRATPSKLIFGNTTDLFVYNEGTEDVSYLTPRYQTGTISITNGTAIVTGVGTLWSANLKAGDFMHLGAADEIDPAVVWYEIDSVDSNTQVTLTTNFAETTLAAQPYTARQTLTGDIRTPFFTETFLDAVDVSGTDGDRWYATNGVDPVVAWDGIADQVYLPAFGNVDTCVALRRFKNILVLVAPTTSGEFRGFSVRTSDIGRPEDTVAGFASEFIVHDGPDQLLNAFEFGELLVLYSERHITLMQFVGGDTIFVLRTAVTGFGPKSSRAIAQFPDHHEFIGADCQYIFDGARADPINKHVWRDVVRRISPQRLDMIHAHFDEENGELVWILPLNSDADAEEGTPETAYAQHYLEDVGQNPTPHTYRQLPALCTGYFVQSGSITFAELVDAWEEYNVRWDDQALQDAFPTSLFGDALGNIWIMNSQDSQAGVAPVAYARFGRRLLGNSSRKGIIKRTYPFIERLSGSEAELTVSTYISNTADGPAALQSELTLSMGIPDERHFVSPMAAGRYAETLFGTETIGPWRLSGYDQDVIGAGER